MNITVLTDGVKATKIVASNVVELERLENLYFAILCKVFLNKPALLVTIEPQKKSSLGYEIGSFQELKLGKDNFLLNIIQDLSYTIIIEISKSEEFNRGLLILMTGEIDFSRINADLIDYVRSDFSNPNFAYKALLCENDGETLCLYNSELTADDLSPIVSEFENNDANK